MARIQILELPTIYHRNGDDETPFAIIVDQTEPQRIVLGVDAPWRDYWQDIADKIGARAAIVTPETIDIPANAVTLEDGDTAGVVRLKVEPDPDGFSEQVEQEIRYAQGKVTRALKQTDTALAALVYDTLGLDIANPGPSEAPDYPTLLATACRELQKSEGARAFLLRHKVALTDALGVDRLRDWDDIRNAAAGIRRERDALRAADERVRTLHAKQLQDDRHEDTGICATDAEDWPCPTIRALNNPQRPTDYEAGGSLPVEDGAT